MRDMRIGHKFNADGTVRSYVLRVEGVEVARTPSYEAFAAAVRLFSR